MQDLMYLLRFVTTLLAILLFFRVDGPAARQTVVSGSVTDESGASLPLANIYFEGTTQGTVSDLSGRFQFTTHLRGDAELVVSVLGYKPWRKSFSLSGTDSLKIRVRLREEALNLGEASVTGSAFSGLCMQEFPSILTCEITVKS